MDSKDTLVANFKATRQIEEIAETLDERIIKKVPEDQALFVLAYDCEEGHELAEKYAGVADDISKLRDELLDCVRAINATDKYDLAK